MAYAGMPNMILTEKWNQVLSTKTNQYLVAYRSPAFSPEHNMILNLFSNEAIRVESFQQIPFPQTGITA